MLSGYAEDNTRSYALQCYWAALYLAAIEGITTIWLPFKTEALESNPPQFSAADVEKSGRPPQQAETLTILAPLLVWWCSMLCA